MNRKRILCELGVVVGLAIGGLWVLRDVSSVQSKSLGISWSRGQFIDLGDVSAGTVLAEFALRNDGSRTVVFSDVKGSCGCMSVGVSGMSLTPGSTVTCRAKILIDAGQRRSTIVFFKVSEPVETVLTATIACHGVEAEEWRADESALVLREVDGADGLRGTVTIRRQTGGGVALAPPVRTEMTGTGGEVFATVRCCSIDGGRGVQIEMDARSDEYRAPPTTKLLVMIGSPVVSRLAIPVTVEASDPVRLTRTAARVVIDTDTVFPVDVVRGQITPAGWELAESESAQWLTVRRETADGVCGYALTASSAPPRDGCGNEVVTLVLTTASGKRKRRVVEVAWDCMSGERGR